MATLNGTIYDQFNDPAPNVTVQAFDRDLRTETLLGEAKTNPKGQYSISYEASNFSRAEKKTADIFLRILIRLNDNNQQELAKSPTHFNVPESYILDYKIGGTPYQGASEFDSLVALFAPLLEGQRVKFHQLKEDDEHQDISFLVAETGVDPNKIALLPIAFENSIKAKNNIAPDIFYGLLRVQFPARYEDLLRVQEESIRKGIEEAITKNIISAKWQEKTSSIIERFNSLSAQFILRGEQTENVAFQKMIGATISDQEQQKTFINTLYATEAKPEKFWEKLAEKPGFREGDIIKETQKVLRLNRITNQPILTTRLYSEHKELKELSDFAKLTKADFSRHISALVSDGSFGEFPLGVEGQTPEEKTKNYAELLEDLMRELFPTDVFKFRLKADQADLLGPAKPDLTKFLEQNPEVDITTTKIDAALRQADFSGINNRSRLEQTLKQVNRVTKLSTRYDYAGTLLGAGLDSASAIAALPKKEFIEKIQGRIPTKEIEKIYAKSVRVDQRATALAVRYHTANDTAVYALNGGKAATANVQSIFGDINLCDCAHCQSVYSPSAYLVDMLGIMKKREPQAFEEFERRRADITHIQLTCKNTNTVLPYIDLVNEVLENQIANDGEIDAATLPQTSLSAEELAASPEHENPAAYEKLVSDFSAPQLPFNLPLEKARLFLDKLRNPRHMLMELFSGGKATAKYDDIAIAAEYLRWSVEELNYISGEEPLPDANIDETKINEVAYYLELTGLTYAELQQILNSEVVSNTGLEVKIADTDNNAATCDIELMRFEGMEIDQLKKHLRLVRLWKKLAWSIKDLDTFFKVFNTSNFDSDPDSFNTNITLPLSHTLRLQKAFKWSIPQIMALWSGDAEATRSAFAISESEFELYNQAPALADIPGLNGENNFYRYTILAKKLGITVEEIWQLIALTGVTPFGGLSTTADTLKFIDLVVFITGSPLFIPELFQILRPSDAGLLEVDQLAVANFFDELQIGLQTLNTQISDPEEQSAAQEKLIGDALSVAFKVEPVVATFIMAVHAASPWFTIDEQGSFSWQLPDLVSTFRVLKATFVRLAFLRDKLSISPEEVQYFQKNKIAFQISEIWNLPDDNNATGQYAPFEKILYLLKFRDSLDEPPADWFTLFDPVLENIADSKSLFVDTLTSLSNFEKTDIEFLIGAGANNGELNYSFPDDFLSGKHQLEILACLKKADQLGTKPQNLSSLAKLKLSQTEATIAEKLWKSRYNEKDGLEALQEINKPLQEKKRNALVSYLLHASESVSFRTKNRIANINDLYAHFLMDVEMSACMMTSRIKQAISSVQLFIDRCLMGLETLTVEDDAVNEVTIKIAKEFATQWNEWRKVYRVWEANRKVFLYPENWIKPELRNDKSPFFKDLESKLSQNEVTDDLAKEALLEYLEKLDTVANLEIIAFFPDEATKITHVLGRTKNIPHQYFYRKQENSIWTAWESVELDIQGDHVLLVVWNDRLMVFWGEFAEKQENSTGISLTLSKGITENGGEITSSDSPRKFLKMKLSWSEYKNGKWESKKISKDDIPIHRHIIDATKAPFSTKGVSLSAKFNDKNLIIRVFADIFGEYDQDNRFGAFYFENCYSAPTFIETSSEIGGIKKLRVKTPSGTFPTKMHIKKDSLGKAELLLFNVTGIYSKSTSSESNSIAAVLNNTEENFQILPNHFQIEKDKTAIFFFNDENHNFYVKSYQRLIKDELDQGVITENTFLTRSFVSPSSVNPFINDSGVALLLPDGEVPGNNEDASILVAELPTTTQPTTQPSPGSGHSLINRKRYQFQMFYHPYVCKYIETLNTEGIDALYTVSEQNTSPEELFTDTQYQPNPANVKKPYPVEEVDFSTSGTYSIYNWELFFHIPYLIATKLNQNQKFEEARKWFHFIFDPTMPVTNGDTTARRFWITKPFRTEIENSVLSIEELINEEDNEAELKLQLKHWENNPFQPYVVANFRPSSYMRATLMKYIDNLIDWGDQLFRRDSIESINEATLLYVLAQNLLGEKQPSIEALEQPKFTTFAAIQEDLNPFNVAKVAMESYLSLDNSEDGAGLEGIVSMPLFCLPKNDELVKYWDTVADRLFKIRHCQNIEGVVRQLPLFEPPISVDLLVRAASAGLDLNKILNDSQVAVPHYRFQVMMQKANEFCNDVKSLGSQFLAAYEKQDAEELSLLRSSQEIKLLELVKDIKKKQIDEAKENIKSLRATRKVTEERKNYFESQEFINTGEAIQLQSNNVGLQLQLAQASAQTLSTVQHQIPDVKLGSPTTAGPIYGGSQVGSSAESASKTLGILSAVNNWIGALAGTLGTYHRRQDEWKFQAKSAELELQQIDKQLIASEIRLAIAEKDLSNHEVQMEQSRKVEEYLKGKFTNKELYDHMVKQLSSLFFQSYQLAYDLAKKAEQCYRFELGITESNIVQFGHWDSLKKGLLSGEKLQFDLRRLENFFLENNKREFEITKHISLRRLDPEKLLQLKAEGKAAGVTIPEWLFDLDCPGNYKRRIKTVGLSIPCVTGPYTSVNCKVELVSSKIRVKAAITDNDIENLISQNANIKSIVTSSAQSDNGMFDSNLRDERYLPFEGAGVVDSVWNLKLPEIKQFDYNTISDVILHISYTALDGGVNFTEEIENKIKEQDDRERDFYQLLSLQHDFPSAWHDFLNPNIAADGNVFDFNLTANHFPYRDSGHELKINSITIISKSTKTGAYIIKITHKALPLEDISITKRDDFGGLHRETKDVSGNSLTLDFNEENNWKLELETPAGQGANLEKDEIEELFLILGYEWED